MRAAALSLLVLLFGCASSAREPAHQISADGFGPVRIGMTMEGASQALGVTLEATNYSEDPASCDIVVPPGTLYRELHFLTINQRISAARLFWPTDEANPVGVIRTAEHIGIGSTGDEIRAAYGAAVTQEIQPYSGGDAFDLYVVRPDGRGIRFQLSQTERVWAVHAGEESAIRLWEGCL